MNTGALRHVVTLEIPNGNDGYLPLDPPTWRCAVLTDGSGSAVLVGRDHVGITTATRVHFKGRVYHVDSLTNREERDRLLELRCSEVFA